MTEIVPRVANVTSAVWGAPRGDDAALRRAAEALEAAFLSEMLKGAGLGEARDALGGGVGEAQFASMLRDRQAEALARAGGIGLADGILAALARRGAAP